MAKLPPVFSDPTLEAVAAAQVAAQDTNPRGYLGASSIGDPCARKLWYRFRWVTVIRFDVTSIRRFEDGHTGEDVMAKRLRMVRGIQLITVDPNTRKQCEFIDVGGHVAGHMDGAVLGVIQAPKTWHVWEHKQTDEKIARELAKLVLERGEKDALEAWDDVYFGQAQIYMHWTGMERHYLTCGTPGGRDYVSCRTEYQPKKAQRLIERARQVVMSPRPLAKISEDPSWYACKFCDLRTVCHEGKTADVNCRTCLHSTPIEDGKGGWRCEKHNMEISAATQKVGCGDHLFIPDLITFASYVDAGEDHVVYQLPDGRQFKNGPHGEGSYTSKELAALETPAILHDNFVSAMRKTFDAQISSRKVPA